MLLMALATASPVHANKHSGRKTKRDRAAKPLLPARETRAGQGGQPRQRSHASPSTSRRGQQQGQSYQQQQHR